MERMVVIVFEKESQAFDGKSALGELTLDGSITDYADAVIVRNRDGSTAVEQISHAVPIGTIGGTALGSLIGLFGGPLGLGIGTGAGFVAGIVADVYNSRIGADFVDEVLRELTPGKYAVVADIDEPSTGPLDRRMEMLSGKVFRRSKSKVRHALHEEHVAAMKADLAAMRAEFASAQADRRARLAERMNRLESGIQAQLERRQRSREAAEQEARARVEARKKAAEMLKAHAAAIHV